MISRTFISILLIATRVYASPDTFGASSSNGVVGIDDWNIPQTVLSNPLFVPIEKGISAFKALEILNQRMIDNGLHPLFSTKTSHSVLGREVEVGCFGVYSNAGRPEILVKPGRYWNFNPAIKWV